MSHSTQRIAAAAEVIERARELLERGRPGRALAALERARVPAALRGERDYLEAEAWRGRGRFLRAAGLYRSALAATRPGEDAPLWLEASLGLAGCLRALGEVGPARRALSVASKVARRRRLPAVMERIELESALVVRASGRYGESLRRLTALLGRRLRAGRRAEAAFVLWAMGGALRFRGDLAASRAAYARALELFRREGDPAGQGYARFGLGGVTRMLGRLKESARHYDRARQAFHKTEDDFGKAYAWCGLANALRQQGRLGEALRLYRRSRELYRRLEDEPDLAYVEWGIGKVHLQRGELAAARGRFQRALGLFLKHREARGAALAELALGQALHASGDAAGAERLFARGVRRARRHGLRTHLEAFT